MSGPPFTMSKYASEADLLRDKCAWLEGQLAEKNKSFSDGAKLWECPECCFRFDAGHTDPDGTYSCPVCAEGPLRAYAVALHHELTVLHDAMRLCDGRTDPPYHKSQRCQVVTDLLAKESQPRRLNHSTEALSAQADAGEPGINSKASGAGGAGTYIVDPRGLVSGNTLVFETQSTNALGTVCGTSLHQSNSNAVYERAHMLEQRLSKALGLLKTVQSEWVEVETENSGLLWQIRHFLGMNPDHVTGECVHQVGTQIEQYEEILAAYNRLKAPTPCPKCEQDVYPEHGYRCVDCDRVYHRQCLRQHCAGELERVSGELERLRHEAPPRKVWVCPEAGCAITDPRHCAHCRERPADSQSVACTKQEGARG